MLLLLVLLLIFGPKRLPEAGKSLGKGIREFKDSLSNDDKEREELPPPPAVPATEEKTEPVAATTKKPTA